MGGHRVDDQPRHHGEGAADAQSGDPHDYQELPEVVAGEQEEQHRDQRDHAAQREHQGGGGAPGDAGDHLAGQQAGGRERQQDEAGDHDRGAEAVTGGGRGLDVADHQGHQQVHPDARDQAGHVRGQDDGVAQHAQVDQRVGGAQLVPQPADQQQEGGGRHRPQPGAAPAPGLALAEYEQQADQGQAEQHRAERVERAPRALCRRGQDQGGQQQGQGADHGAEPEACVDAEGLGDQAGDRVAEADAGDGGDGEQRDVEREAAAGRLSRAVAMASGVSPSPTPCSARPATSQPKPSGSAASTLPSTTTPTAVRVTVRRCGPSPRRPSTGVATAPTSIVMVSDHWASESETWSTAAMVGIIGAPRLLITATTALRNTRTGTRARSRRVAWPVGVRMGAPSFVGDRVAEPVAGRWPRHLRGRQPGDVII